jgi:hypothetical protein
MMPPFSPKQKTSTTNTAAAAASNTPRRISSSSLSPSKQQQPNRGVELADALLKIKKLRDEGYLTPEEFQKAKEKILE